MKNAILLISLLNGGILIGQPAGILTSDFNLSGILTVWFIIVLFLVTAPALQASDRTYSLSGTVTEIWSGELDPDIFGDTCVIYVRSYADGKIYGLLESSDGDIESCTNALTFEDRIGFPVQIPGPAHVRRNR